MQLNRDRAALLGGVLLPVVVALALVPLRDSIPPADAALVLVLAVVAIAANGYRLAGALAAVSAGVSFDFFFTHPYERLSITRSSDVFTTGLLLAVGLGVTELALRGRHQRELASRAAGYLAGVHDAGDVITRGGSADLLIRDVTAQLTHNLHLHGCRFQEGVAGMGDPPRLERNGQVTWHRRVWDADRRGLPAETETELLVENHGLLYGRFMLDTRTPTPLSLTERLAAVTLADQIGAALH